MQKTEAPSFAGAQRHGARVLTDSGVETAALDARVLLCHAAGLSHAGLIAQSQDQPDEAVLDQFDKLLKRRAQGEPVARILQEKEFWGLTFRLGPETLVPRPDSEAIVAAARDEMGNAEGGVRLLDLGTGSGCLLLSLLAELPQATGVGADISESALAVARENAVVLNLDDRAAFVVSDWTGGIIGTFDLVVSNPPYIPSSEIGYLDPEVRNFDPSRALDGGGDGLASYRQILESLPRILTPGGRAVFETSPDLYAELYEMIDQNPQFGRPQGVKDLAGRWRGLRFGKSDLPR